MNDLPRKYRYRYRMELFGGHWHHSYELIGRWGGLALNITDFGDENIKILGQRYSAGLECHYRQPPNYMSDAPPSHDKCSVLGGCPCWHDGTSLYAQEHFVPLFDGVSHDRMFRHLAADADGRFEACAPEAANVE